MFTFLSAAGFDDRSADLRQRVSGIYTLLILANIGVWLWALYLFRHQPMLLRHGASGLQFWSSTRCW